MRVNFKVLTMLFLWVLVSCDDGIAPDFVLPKGADLSESFYVHIDLNDRFDDTFKVEMYVGGLSVDHAVIQFAATVPGTYDIMNVGRFVQNFEVRDEKGKFIPSEAISTNQWQISRPADAHKITYQVKETFDTEVKEYPIYAMAGTSIEEDHVLLNTPMVIGYPVGLKERDYFVSLSYPSNWTVGTALPAYEEFVYQATDFDHLADSPILLGELTSRSTDLGDASIHVHVYSEYYGITATHVLDDVNQILIDAEAFLKVLPTDQYDFLYHFGDVNAGALEHSKSSVYVLKDAPYEKVNYGPLVKSISAHEFFHVVTPLNIHSEIIADFNFAVPTPSQHLWLYEGVTEWASDFMQYRNGSMSLVALLAQLKEKVKVDQTKYDLNFSLQQIGTEAYTVQGSPQFNNVYNRGAVVASLLDIRLLELSGGTYGLREVILELIDEFGPDHAFSEVGFFDTFVNMTYPEIADFFDDYIKDTQPLPIAAYFSKVGIAYDPLDFGFSKMSSLTVDQATLFAAWSKNM
ncbi:peptidase [Reichenbachiella carrageenanivorans]|uniref:Peptidase n=1 Tax=Reichenbachiella carrageenanivorans TaxID=2979869 RepID=A0ABY6D4I7_9BACT|nr:peptidase [Reichenbachiella carrageenanivorans]UXX81070.1 peptidase [Reichenbachiella carrageenanivorans]